jgi:hypothetical protein
LIWRLIHTFRSNGKLGFNLARELNISACPAVILATFCFGITAYAGTIQQSDVSPLQNIAHQYPLEDRVSSAPEELLKRFSAELKMKLSAHIVTPAERAIVTNALTQLTPFQREVLQNRLHAIYFIDGLPNNALTFPDGGPTHGRMYSIIVRAGVLHETVSELVTRKERTLFDSPSSDLSGTVDGGTLDAMIYVLLHETTHVVDFSVGATPDATHASGDHPLVSGIWRDSTTPADEYRLPVLMGIVWKSGRATPNRAGFRPVRCAWAHTVHFYLRQLRLARRSRRTRGVDRADRAFAPAIPHRHCERLEDDPSIRASKIKAGPSAHQVFAPTNRILVPLTISHELRN